MLKQKSISGKYLQVSYSFTYQTILSVWSGVVNKMEKFSRIQIQYTIQVKETYDIQIMRAKLNLYSTFLFSSQYELQINILGELFT